MPEPIISGRVSKVVVQIHYEALVDGKVAGERILEPVVIYPGGNIPQIEAMIKKVEDQTKTGVLLDIISNGEIKL